MLSFFKLIRYKNLLILAFTQFIIQQFIIAPILQKYGFEYHSADMVLYLLIASTVFTAAAGYVINDYFDIKIDKINKPEKVYVSTVFSKQQAMLMHQVFTGFGLITGLFLAYTLKSFTLGFIFIITPGLLWFYSASYKRQFLTGNIIVSALAGLSVLTVGISTVADLKSIYGQLIYETPIPREIYAWVGGFATFSFLLTLIRELIKDIQDIKGDSEMECRTVAIVWGENKTKILIYSLVLFTIILLVTASFYIPFESSLSLKYIIFGLIIPLLVFCYLTYKANNRFSYNTASQLLKYIMLSGVSYAFIFYFLMAKTYNLSLFNLFLIK